MADRTPAPVPPCPRCEVDPHSEPAVPHVHFTDYGYVLYTPNHEMREASGPYTVTLTIIDLSKTENRTDVEEVHVAGGRWSEVLYYTSGERIEVNLRVQGHADDTFACHLWDGAANRDSSREKGVASCAIVTEQ